MKYFALYAPVKLIEKPSWLDDFRAKYDEPYDLHVTLKQPCFISNLGIETLKEEVARFIGSQVSEPMELEFTEFIYDEPGDLNDGCIMIKAVENATLRILHKGLIELLSGYTDFCDPRTQSFEENFMPHITISCNLSSQMYEKAVSELPKIVSVRGVIDEVVLAIVADKSESERKNPQNLVAFKLEPVTPTF